MEHSVCKVSLAHHTKEWLSALFEALEGLELSVNNYLFTLLWIACRNKRLSRHLHQRSPSTSLHVTSHRSCWERRKRGGNGETVSLYNVSFVHEEKGLCPVIILPLNNRSSFTIWSCSNRSATRFKHVSLMVLYRTAAETLYFLTLFSLKLAEDFLQFMLIQQVDANATYHDS